jgi:hypothetical protein
MRDMNGDGADDVDRESDAENRTDNELRRLCLQTATASSGSLFQQLTDIALEIVLIHNTRM